MDKNNERKDRIIADLIRAIHYLLIGYVILVPLTNSPILLAYHFQLVIFLLFKWIIKRGKCGLTECEYRLRGIQEQEGFVYSVLQPIIDISETQLNWLCYAVVIILGLVSYHKWQSLTGEGIFSFLV